MQFHTAPRRTGAKIEYGKSNRGRGNEKIICKKPLEGEALICYNRLASPDAFISAKTARTEGVCLRNI